MKIKTSELIGPALDWAVAECLDYVVEFEGYYDDEQDREIIIRLHGPEVPGRYAGNTEWHPSADWSQGGPIIEHLRGNSDHQFLIESDGKNVHVLSWPSAHIHFSGYGPTLLIAAMRCYCCAKLGDEIDIPQELQPCQQPNL